MEVRLACSSDVQDLVSHSLSRLLHVLPYDLVPSSLMSSHRSSELLQCPFVLGAQPPDPKQQWCGALEGLLPTKGKVNVRSAAPHSELNQYQTEILRYTLLLPDPRPVGDGSPLQVVYVCNNDS